MQSKYKNTKIHAILDNTLCGDYKNYLPYYKSTYGSFRRRLKYESYNIFKKRSGMRIK
jgi:hypothetical protein